MTIRRKVIPLYSSDSLFCGGLERTEVAERNGGQRVGQGLQNL